MVFCCCCFFSPPPAGAQPAGHRQPGAERLPCELRVPGGISAAKALILPPGLSRHGTSPDSKTQPRPGAALPGSRGRTSGGLRASRGIPCGQKGAGGAAACAEKLSHLMLISLAGRRWIPKEKRGSPSQPLSALGLLRTGVRSIHPPPCAAGCCPHPLCPPPRPPTLVFPSSGASCAAPVCGVG